MPSGTRPNMAFAARANRKGKDTAAGGCTPPVQFTWEELASCTCARTALSCTVTNQVCRPFCMRIVQNEIIGGDCNGMKTEGFGLKKVKKKGQFEWHFPLSVK